MADDELTPEDERMLDEEIAHASAILDSERAAREAQLQAEVFGPDPALKTFLGDADPKPIEEWGGGIDPSESDEEWVSRAQREVFGNGEMDAGRLDDHEGRLLELEDPDPEPELLTDEQPWRWAKLTTAWAFESNTVDANPCLEAGAAPDTDTTLTLYCTLPTDNVPPFVGLAIDDVVAYVPFYDSANEEERGVIVGAALLPEIPNKTKNYGLVYDTSDDSVKWVELQGFACP